MRLTEEQRSLIISLKETLEKQAGQIADLGMETGRRDFVMASSQVQGAKMVLLTILTDDKNEEFNGPRTQEGPQLVGKGQGN